MGVLEWLVVALVVLIIVLGFGIVNLLKKLERYEEAVDEYNLTFLKTYDRMKSAYDRMKSIDKLGSFESDDEAGGIFTEIKAAMNSLNDEFNLDDNLDGGENVG